MMVSEPKPRSRPRGRPRAYDPDLALARARDTFWWAGYAGTTLDELAIEMRMNRPSIYAAFGGKEVLYLKAVARYADDSRAALANALAQARPLPEAIRGIYHAAARWYLAGDGGPRGCFLIGTAVTEARRNQEVRAIVESTLDAFTDIFADRFARAALEGELAPHSATALAHVATATLNTIALRARTGAEPEVFDAIIDATVDVICGSGKDTHQ
jgi:TetR/AcrR family transcriptional regulator, copper-responsive repressor